MTPDEPIRVLCIDVPAAATDLGPAFAVEANPTAAGLERLHHVDFQVVVLGRSAAEHLERARGMARRPAAFLLLRPEGTQPLALPENEMVSTLDGAVDPARLGRMVEQLARLVAMRRSIAAAARPTSRATVRPISVATPAVPSKKP